MLGKTICCRLKTKADSAVTMLKHCDDNSHMKRAQVSQQQRGAPCHATLPAPTSPEFQMDTTLTPLSAKMQRPWMAPAASALPRNGLSGALRNLAQPCLIAARSQAHHLGKNYITTTLTTQHHDLPHPKPG